MRIGEIVDIGEATCVEPAAATISNDAFTTNAMPSDMNVSIFTPRKTLPMVVSSHAGTWSFTKAECR